MSTLKIERDTVRRGTESLAGAARDGHLPGTSGKHPIAEKIGTAITGGKGNAGTKGYLMVCNVVPSCTIHPACGSNC
jgi:hypothetical protein